MAEKKKTVVAKKEHLPKKRKNGRHRKKLGPKAKTKRR
jgi:hypothetical protein